MNRALRISGISPRNLQDLIVSIDESASPSRFDERPDGDAADEERAAATKRQKFLFPLIYRAGNLVDAHHVLGITAKRLAVPFAAISRIDAPVNEASELCFAPPGDP